MFDKIRQIIKDKYGKDAHLYEPKEETRAIIADELAKADEQPEYVSPYLDGTFPMPKSKRSASGRSSKSNRKRLSHNAKLKRRRAA